jgi:hypothetical protein
MVVVGLSQTEDLSAVRTALSQAGLPPDDLESVGPDDAAQNLARGQTSSGIITTDRGAHVPGIDGDENPTFFYDENLVDRLGDFGIPEKEMDNYLEAIERGKTVVACFVKPDNAETATKFSAAFSAANLANVRQY